MKRLNIIILFFGAIIFVATTAFASTTYTVKQGDNLFRLSKKFNTTESDIKKANKLDSIKLKVGMKLVMPEAVKTQANNDSAESKTESKEEGSKASDKKNDTEKDSTITKQVKSKKAVTAEVKTYTVMKGDNIYRIAKKFSLKVETLKELNELENNSIKPGQKLIISGQTKEPSGKTVAYTAKTYTVKKGDNIYRISRKFHISTDSLKEINGLQNNALKPGQKLLLAKKESVDETKAADETKDEETNESKPGLLSSFNKKPSPAATSAKLKEVKELSGSDNLSEMSMKERVLLFAKKMLHLPYRFGGNGSVGLDCSAYVQKVYGLAGLAIPRSAREQFRVGDAIDKKELSIGDLVFFKTYASFPSHVGIYLGNNLFIHASSLSKKITIDSLDAPYYFRRFIGAKRVVTEDAAKDSDDDNDSSS